MTKDSGERRGQLEEGMMTRDELLFMAKEFLNSEKWHVALTKGNDFIAQQATLADFGEEVLRVEKAREEALES